MSHLILPLGGAATRLLGLPKFLMPISNQCSLLQYHINSAINSGIEKISILIRPEHLVITRNHLGDLAREINWINLQTETKTMCETLIRFVGSEFFEVTDNYLIALADTVFVEHNGLSVYSQMTKRGGAESNFKSLGLFRIRPDQKGKLGQVLMSPITGNIEDIVDKSPDCPYEYIWGICNVTGKLLETVLTQEAHVGISIQRWLKQGEIFRGVVLDSDYFDCGTFDEYRHFLDVSNL